MLRTKRDAVFCDRVLENGANEYLLAKTGVDTAENEPLKVADSVAWENRKLVVSRVHRADLAELYENFRGTD